MTAHIVTSAVPSIILWASAVALAVAVLVLILVRRRGLRRMALVLLVAGGAGAAGGYIAATPPPSNGLTISFVSPHSGAVVDTPLVIEVCGQQNGLRADVPGTGRLLLVSIDGVPGAESPIARTVVAVPGGDHDITAELISSDHRELSPAVTATVHVTIHHLDSIPVAAALCV